MKHIIFAATLLLSLALPAAAQESLRAEMIWFGNYTASESQTVIDPTSPTGKRLLSTNVKAPATNSERIAIVRGDIRFGFGYRLIGSPNGARVKTIHIDRFPGSGIRGGGGALQESTTVVREDVIGDTGHIGWRMDGNEPKEYEGAWTFQLWSEQKLLLERKFTVYRP